MRDRQVARKSCAGNLPDVIQHRMNVDGFFVNGALIPEDFHAVDEIANAIRFLGDEVGERPVFLGRARFQQLRRAPDPRKRIFDFMGQHRRHRGDRAGRAPVRELPLDHGGHAALLHHDQHMILVLGEQRSENIDRSRRLIGGAEIDFVFVDGSPRLPHLVCKGRKRVGECQHRVQCTLFKQRFAYAEKHLGGEVCEDDAIFTVDDEENMRETLDKRFEIKRLGVGGSLFPGLPPAGHRVKQSGLVRRLRRWKSPACIKTCPNARH